MRRYRPSVKTNPAGALVQAIRDEWAPPQAWLDAKVHETAVTHQAEEETARRAQEEERRRRWEAMAPEERVQRVYYDVEGELVRVQAIGTKRGNRIFIGGQEVDLNE
jgi:hypothetical protein